MKTTPVHTVSPFLLLLVPVFVVMLLTLVLQNTAQVDQEAPVVAGKQTTSGGMKLIQVSTLSN